jgi:uncharacterized membrane protein YraQ (UPF0718 family)
MYMVILVFGFFGIALGTGWVAQLLTGRRSGRIDWTQAFWVGVAGMGIAWLVAWLLDRKVGTTFGIAGFIVAIAAAFAIQLVLNAREKEVRAEEHHREKELTPEGLPGHHQPQKHKKKKSR